MEKKKCFGGSVRASADLLPPAREGWLSLAAVRDGNAFPLGSSKPGEVPDTFRSAFRCRWPSLAGQGPTHHRSARWKGPSRDHGAAAGSGAGAMRSSTPMTDAPNTRRKAGTRERSGASRQKTDGFLRHRFGRPPSARRATAPERGKKAAFSFGPAAARFLFRKTEKKMGGGGHYRPPVNSPPNGAGASGQAADAAGFPVQWDALGASPVETAPGGSRSEGGLSPPTLPCGPPTTPGTPGLSGRGWVLYHY